MIDEFIDIANLSPIIGYTDLRTIRKWCRKNNLPIVPFGRKEYIHREDWEAFKNANLDKVSNLERVKEQRSTERVQKRVNVDDVFNSYKKR